MKQTNCVKEIIAFESGELSEEDILKLFSKLIKSGLCWNLQGFYGRTARDLIENGFISTNGRINWKAYEQAIL